jgi:hypothetical protein
MQFDTAMGTDALFSNATSFYNTAAGAYALYSNTDGNYNTASGAYALYSNTSGDANTACGEYALNSNTTGDNNTAVGQSALSSNTTGFDNTAIGLSALESTTTGSYNTAAGFYALLDNTTGTHNTAVGYETLFSNSTGIEGSKITGAAVYVTASGQLGVLASSERYKTAIAPLGPNSAKLGQLRPVSFHLKSDPTGAAQYGLIAEEVDKVYPELVIRDQAGEIQGVRYEELAPMLLSEVQQQTSEIRHLKQLVTKVSDLEHELAEMRTALAALQPKDQLVASVDSSP